MPPDTQDELLVGPVAQSRRPFTGDTFKRAVERQQDCSARFVRSVLVWELLKGEIVEERTVHLFDLFGCEAASMAYAWRSGPRIVVVTHGGAAVGPAEAVQAVLQEGRT